MYKRKDGLYESVKTYKGKRVYFRGKTQREVYRKIEEYESQGEQATLPSFDVVADQWAESHFEELTDGSIRSYEPALKRAKARYGGISIGDITSQDISQWMTLLGKEYAQKTVRNQRAVLKMIFDYAILDIGIKIDNPVERVKVSDKLKQETRDALTEEQRQEILNTRPNEFILAPLILYTGLRLGEALALRSDRIDFENKVIHIVEAVHFKGNKPVIGQLKTKNSRRDIPLLPQLEDLIKGINGYIINDDGKPITQSMLTRRWEHWCREHNLAIEEHRDSTTNNRHTSVWKPVIDRHQIRHEYATTLWEAGISLETSSHLLGHADIQTTSRIYQHYRETHLKDASQKLTDWFAKQ